jgi:predicted amidohydrolase
MRVAAVQHDIVWEDAAANFTRLAPMLRAAAGQGSALVLLTEMFATGFSMEADRIAEDPDGPTVTFLREQSAALDVWLGASFPERVPDEPRPRNRFVLVAPDGWVHRYSKIHPFRYGGEADRYSAGSETLTVEVGGLRVTPFVCYDLRFADVFWKTAAQTDLYVVVANWPAVRAAHWSTLLRARAIENQAYVAGVNRVGSGGGLDYAGGSVIVDPWGDVVAEAGERETTILADVDPRRVADVRGRFPFLSDR